MEKIREAEARWQGNLKSGKGIINLKSIDCEGNYSFKSRFEEGSGTNPEELISMAHASCFSMALADLLAEKGFIPQDISTKASVSLRKEDDGFTIYKSKLTCSATVPEIDDDTLKTLGDLAKENCPVSKVLAFIYIELQIHLVG